MMTGSAPSRWSSSPTTRRHRPRMNLRHRSKATPLRRTRNRPAAPEELPVIAAECPLYGLAPVPGSLATEHVTPGTKAPRKPPWVGREHARRPANNLSDRLRLCEALAVGRLQAAASRRARGAGYESERRRSRRASARLLARRLSALLHQPGQGLLAQSP